MISLPVSVEGRKIWRRVVVLLAVLAVVLIGGCSPGSGNADLSSGASWVEPAWMAKHVAAREEADAATHSCLLAKGWDIEPIEGGTGLSFDLSDFADHVVDSLFADAELCQESLGFELNRQYSRTELERFYWHLIDVHECLIAHGVAMVQDPPSISSWVEDFQHAQATSGPVSWWPYMDPGFISVTWDEYLELSHICPQPFMP
ncbi:MAG: hypothetical protein FWD83_05125 [Promicromonosporaceae bacterium]|nr:hypothetical protein [Promicromonosporaceae bacterium]